MKNKSAQARLAHAMTMPPLEALQEAYGTVTSVKEILAEELEIVQRDKLNYLTLSQPASELFVEELDYATKLMESMFAQAIKASTATATTKNLTASGILLPHNLN